MYSNFEFIPVENENGIIILIKEKKRDERVTYTGEEREYQI